jgi:hypothetical protein
MIYCIIKRSFLATGDGSEKSPTGTIEDVKLIPILMLECSCDTHEGSPNRMNSRIRIAATMVTSTASGMIFSYSRAALVRGKHVCN